MPECPRCHQSVATTAIACPHCRATLKAHGHPGMVLFRATGSEPLCLSCAYHADDTCTFPKRPHAMDCTLYVDRANPSPSAAPAYPRSSLKTWMQRHSAWLALVGLLLVSLLIVLVR